MSYSRLQKKILFPGKITTLYGKEGMGRTTLAYSFLKKKAVYLTPIGFNINRLLQVQPHNLSNILIGRIGNEKEIDKYLNVIKSMKDISIVVIDPITDLYRLLGTQKQFSKTIDKINTLAKDLNIPFVLISDIYTNFKTQREVLVNGDILKYISYCIGEVKRKGSERFIEVFKPEKEKLDFEITFEGIK